MIKLRIKTGDLVKVLTGKDKGKTGKVLQTFPALQRVVVEGVNVSKRHIKTRRQGEKGQVIEFSMPIHASNVLPVNEAGATIRHDDKATASEKKPAKKAAATKA
ncbi:MAG: 50S ribosomal protein L24 [Patescibacteria group bacterium]|jgi:ribosomal protein L24